MEKFVSRIYRDLKSYCPAVGFVPADDVKQEIRFAIVTARPDQIYKVAHRLVDALLRDYGYSRKKGKDQFQAFYAAEPKAFSDAEWALLDGIEAVYRGEGKTAREVAEMLGCGYSAQFQKLLHQCFPKGLPHGGARKGAGRQKKSSPISIQ